MVEIITGSISKSGTNQTKSDYAQALAFTRPNRDRLAVAIVADGGQDKKIGRMLAQIAVNGVTGYLQRSCEESITDLLTNAIELAHKLVASSFSETGKKAGCSLAVAVIVNEKKLYIANVGSCKIFLARNKQIKQISLDHNYKTSVVLQSKMDYATAACHPNAEQIMRTVGSDRNLMIDIGFHNGKATNIGDYRLAQNRGIRGLPLELGDSIVVASDGLGRSIDNPKSSLILDGEMNRVLNTQTGERGARGLVSFPLGRSGADDVSVSLLQLCQPETNRTQRSWFRRQTGSRMLSVAAFVSVILTICLVTVSMAQKGLNPTASAHSGPNPLELAAVNPDPDLLVQDAGFPTPLPTATPIPTLPPPPTPTPVQPTETIIAIDQKDDAQVSKVMIRPTLAPSPLGFYRQGNEVEFPAIFEDQLIEVSQNGEFQINHTESADVLFSKMEGDQANVRSSEASLYALHGSTLEFKEVDERVELRLYEESDVLIETGRYTAGAKIEVRTENEDVTFTVQDSCLSVVYSEQHQILNGFCLAGSCQYQIGRGEPTDFHEGDRISFNVQDVSDHPATSPISVAVAQSYQNLLLNFYNGIEDGQICLTPYLMNTGH